MKLGAFDYLPKPFTEDEFKSAVEGALKGKQRAIEDDHQEAIDVVAPEPFQDLLPPCAEGSQISRTRNEVDSVWRAVFGVCDQELVDHHRRPSDSSSLAA